MVSDAAECWRPALPPCPESCPRPPRPPGASTREPGPCQRQSSCARRGGFVIESSVPKPDNWSRQGLGCEDIEPEQRHLHDIARRKPLRPYVERVPLVL